MNWVMALLDREIGATSCLERKVCRQRAAAIHFSQDRSVGQPQSPDQLLEHQSLQDLGFGPFSGSVLSLDLELQERRFLLAGVSDGSIELYDLSHFRAQSPHHAALLSKHVAARHPASSELTVQWYPESSAMFVSSGTDSCVKVWDTNLFKMVDRLDMNSEVLHHDLNPHRPWMVAVATAANKMRIVDLKLGSHTHELRGHCSAVLTCRWSPDNEFLLASGSSDGQVILWDVRRSQSCLMKLDMGKGKWASSAGPRAHRGAVSDIRFCGDAAHFVTLSYEDGRLRKWSNLHGRLSSTPLSCISKVRTGQSDAHFFPKMQLTPFFGHDQGNLAFIPNKSDIMLCQVNDGKLISRLEAHFRRVYCCFFNPVDLELYTGAGDRHVYIWHP